MKKAWVETAKIKSKWKAQKRREGILSSHSELESHEDGADIIDENDKSDSVTGAMDLEAEDTATAYSSSPDVKKHGNKIRPSPYDKSNNAEDSANANKEQDKQSLRDLFRKAYSKESLHTYKSGRQQGRGRGRGQGGGTEGKAASMRGQPNMKLRMNAMLEKIKQDYS